jgi:ring-1,2-phenylacetyl-CoA epoxidase subunit PaaD
MMGAALSLDVERQRAEAWAIAAAVCDPEVPVLTIEDLGVLRDVRIENGRVEAVITPTYSGCPAMNLIALNVEVALEEAGFTNVKVTQVLSPAWTTDWMSEDGKAKLRAFGIAPPQGKAGRRALFGEDEVACPRCGSTKTEKISEFGSTACKAHWRCRACAEPFDYFKCL